MHGIGAEGNLDPQITHALYTLQSLQDDTKTPSLKEHFVNFDFRYRRCRNWQKCVIYQERCIKAGDYDQLLAERLRELNRVECVDVCQSWNINPSRPLEFHQAHYYNSPFDDTENVGRASPIVGNMKFHSQMDVLITLRLFMLH